MISRMHPQLKISFAKIKSSVFWRVPVGTITNSFYRFRQQAKYFKGAGSAFAAPKGGLIPVTNSSGGLLKELVCNPHVTLRNNMKILLISEPSGAAQELRDWLQGSQGIEGAEVEILEVILGHVWSEMQSEYDLAQLSKSDLAKVGNDWDLVVCQSLLEHVLDPVKIIDTLMSLKSQGGKLSIQTVNVFMDYHAYPIDCLRFYPDFFIEYGRHRKVTVESWETQASVFAVFG